MQNINKKPASEESIQKLSENLGANFMEFVPLICDFVSLIEESENKNVDNETLNEQRLKTIFLYLNCFALLATLDLGTIIRSNYRTKSAPEKRCNLKYLNVITLEGYKYLFGFGDDKGNGIFDKLYTISQLTNDQELIKDVTTFTAIAKEFESRYILLPDRNARNYSIHYDSDPIKVYDNLLKINEDYEVNRSAAFLKIIENLQVFLIKQLKRYPISLTLNQKYDLTVREITNSFKDNENKIFNLLGTKIEHFSNIIDKVIGSLKMPKIIKEKFKYNNAFFDQVALLSKSSHPGIHICFIYLDLATAIRAYLSSQYYFERQMILRRINIIVYEGFKHLYGYTEKEKNESFWQKQIYSILINTSNQELRTKLNQIKIQLEILANDPDINNLEIREVSVHYRYKHKNNVIPVFHKLIESNPFLIMTKSIKLIYILPDLINLSTDSFISEYKKISNEIARENLKKIELLEKWETILNNSNADSEQKANFSNILNDIKNKLIH